MEKRNVKEAIKLTGQVILVCMLGAAIYVGVPVVLGIPLEKFFDSSADFF